MTNTDARLSVFSISTTAYTYSSPWIFCSFQKSRLEVNFQLSKQSNQSVGTARSSLHLLSPLMTQVISLCSFARSTSRLGKILMLLFFQIATAKSTRIFSNSPCPCVCGGYLCEYSSKSPLSTLDSTKGGYIIIRDLGVSKHNKIVSITVAQEPPYPYSQPLL